MGERAVVKEKVKTLYRSEGTHCRFNGCLRFLLRIRKISIKLLIVFVSTIILIYEDLLL